MKKNAEIELYRFIMIMGVTLLHFTEDYSLLPFYGGYLGVDFCFMLSGYFLMIHFYRHYSTTISPIENSIDYIIGRIKKLYFPYIIAILLMTFVKWICIDGGAFDLFLLLYDNRWQFLMLHSIGAPTVCIIRSVWFLSPLVVLSFFIYFCLCYNKKLFVGLAPILSLLLFVYIAQTYGFLGMHFDYVDIFAGGIIRGFPEMTLGVFVAYMVEEYSNNKNIKVSKVRGIIIRVVCYVVLIYTILKSQWDFNDFNVFPAFAVLIYIAFMNPVEFKFEKIVLYLGGISYWIYLVHNIVGYVIATVYPGQDYKIMTIIYFIITLVLSMIMQFIFVKVNNFIKNTKKSKN